MTIQAAAQISEHNAMKPQPKWQDWGTLAIAALLFVSPWLLGTAAQSLSSWNAWIVATGMVLLTVRTLLPPPGAYSHQYAHGADHIAWWQRIIDSCEYVHIAREQLVVGVWLLVAPWFLGFAATGAGAWATWLAGIAIVLLASSKLLEFRSSRAE